MGNDTDSDTDSDNERFCNTSTNWARFLVVESSTDDLPLGRLSPFVIQKGFQAIAGALKSIKKLKGGSWWNALGNNKRWVSSKPLDLSIDPYEFPFTRS